jgi:hypothetical protein
MAKMMTTRIATTITTPFCELRFDRRGEFAAALEVGPDGALADAIAEGLCCGHNQPLPLLNQPSATISSYVVKTFSEPGEKRVSQPGWQHR